jgi:hypothetical protein
MKTKLILALSLLATATAVGVLLLRRSYRQSFMQDVTQLLSAAPAATEQTFSYQQLSGLPEPVQRYFRHVLPEGYPYIRTVHLRHGGRFKTNVDADWTDITGEQYFTTEPPGFIWLGQTRWFAARDQYVSGQGQLVVHLFSLIPVANERGNTVNEGELLRWLGESVWFPTNLLPSERLEWSPVDDRSAQLQFEQNGVAINYHVQFNDRDEIVRVETQRYMTPERQETWVGKVSNYQRINEVLVPTRIWATWKLPKGDHTYADFWVNEIEYDRYEN